jgi:GGDEF domain-containing protein/ribosomal protein S27E
LILPPSEIEHIQGLIREIRRDIDLCLKPILVVSKSSNLGKFNELIDLSLSPTVSREQIKEEIHSLFKIAQAVSSFRTISGLLSLNEIRRINLLRFMVSREKATLSPYRDPYSKVGYIYPLVAEILLTDVGNEYIELKDMEGSGLLRAKFVDTIHLCPYCEHFHINFRETCPKCKSSNLRIEENIHHYYCAYTGPESEFRMGFDLRCPKCNRRLQHIGVEYDRPSTVYTCNHCGKISAESIVSCLCMNCQRIFLSEAAILRSVNEYEITSEGYRAAEEGNLPSVKPIESIKTLMGLIRKHAFKEILELQIALSARYERYFALVSMKVKNIESFEEGLTSLKVFEEFTEILRSELRVTDLITSLEEGKFLILLNEIKRENASIPLKRIEKKAYELLKAKLELEFNILGFPEDKERIEELIKVVFKDEAQ